MKHLGSDEEAAGTTTHDRQDHTLGTSTEMHVSSLLRHHGEMAHSCCDRLKCLHSSVPDVVSFEVGGEVFAMGRPLLEKDPQSLLFVLAERHHMAEVERGRRGRRRADVAKKRQTSPIRIPGRDPAIFRMLLNVLRGYRHAVLSPMWEEACTADVCFYGLRQSWERRYAPSSKYTFFNPLGGSVLSSDLTYGVAGPFFTSGEHVIAFAVPQAEKVAVGVVGESSPAAFDSSLKALYWSDGKITTNFDILSTSDSGFPYRPAAVIQVLLDADENIVRWVINEDYCVGMLRLPSDTTFAFCACASGKSQVTIVDM